MSVHFNHNPLAYFLKFDQISLKITFNLGLSKRHHHKTYLKNSKTKKMLEDFRKTLIHSQTCYYSLHYLHTYDTIANDLAL